MHESVKFLCNVLILVSLTGGTMALGLGSLQAFFTGSYNVVVGGASLLAFGIYFGNWYSKNFETQTPEDEDHPVRPE
jgi:hypothetical protein